jgi:hypothetical protein
MDERLLRIEDKLDKTLDTQQEIKLNLAEHMRRTQLAETAIEELAEAIKPIQEHVALIRGVSKLFAWMLGIAATVVTIFTGIKGK